MIARLSHKNNWILIALGIAFFLPFLGTVHLFDWDEINFAESSREMMITGNYFQNQINFVPFWEKPPLFFWLQSLSMGSLGINEFGARLPNALCGIFTLLVLYRFGKDLKGERFGMMWALLYLGTLLPHLYFKSGIIDPVFNLFIFCSIWLIYKTSISEEKKQSAQYAALAGLFIGLAIITKGPVGLLIVLLTVLSMWVFLRFKPLTSIKNLILFTLAALVVSFAWFGYETIKNGPWFLGEFITYQIELFTGNGGSAAGHQQPFYYHFVVVLIGCVPLSFFALGSIQKRKEEKEDLLFYQWMVALLAVVMILFSIVSTKIVHYSSMAYFPLSFLAAIYLFRFNRALKWDKIWAAIALGVSLIIGLAFLLVPIALSNKDIWIIPNLNDRFAAASLQQNIELSGWEWMAGALLILFLIIAYHFLFKGNNFRFGAVNAVGLGIALLFLQALVLPKIEQITQGPVVAFLENKAGEDCYLLPIGHKSYAHYFYGQTQPLKDTDGLQVRQTELLAEMEKSSYGELTVEERAQFNGHVQGWLLNADIDKPAYFFLKVHHYKPEQFPTTELIGKEGGFVFLKRSSITNQ